jgi:hypothetical protein
MRKTVWSVLIIFTVLLTVFTFGKEYPLSVPKAILALETGDARVVPLTSDSSKLLGRRGPSEQQLTTFLSKRGWKHKETLGTQIMYEKGNITLNVHSRFRRGYWWYDLDTAP